MNNRRKVVALILTVFVSLGTSMLATWQVEASEEISQNLSSDAEELSNHAESSEPKEIIGASEYRINLNENKTDIKSERIAAELDSRNEDDRNSRRFTNDQLSRGGRVGSVLMNSTGTENNLKNLIAKIEMISNGEDHFGKPAIGFNNDAILKIKLSYDEKNATNMIKKGDKLRIYLSPSDPGKDFIRINYRTSTNTELIDSNKTPSVKIADIDMSNRSGIVFTFTGEAERFDADLSLPFEYSEGDVLEYFNRHPSEKSVTIKYDLKIDNNSIPGKTLEYIIEKPKAGNVIQKFSKTRGIYNQEGELGDGYFLYNIRFSTQLNNKNEYVIYDIPDINQGFDGYLAIYNGQRYGALQEKMFTNYNTDPQKPFTNNAETKEGTKIKVYDVYYMTKETVGNQGRRDLDWENKTLQFKRDDVPGGVIESIDTCTVPKGILIEKPMGTQLTAEERQLIESKGGLYKTVGKGLKVAITDFKSKHFLKGGNITMVYKMGIKNPSEEINSNGNPIYKNFSTYYGQEIPTCKEGDVDCEPLKFEKTKADDFGAPNNPVTAEVKPGTIGADVIIPETNFLKVEADKAGNHDLNKPLAGAIFSIYRSDENGAKNEIAHNAEGLTLDNLITDENGRLTKNGKVVSLNLDKGYYVFSEVSAPEGFEIIQKDIIVAVSYKAKSITIANRRISENIEIKRYNAQYKFKSVNGEKLPIQVEELLPVDATDYEDGTSVNAYKPTLETVHTAGGTWLFKGYDKDKKTINKADILFIGVWDFVVSPKPPIKQEGNVYVEYIAENGKILEAISVVKENAPIGEKYTTAQKTFGGYEFLKMGDGSAAREGVVSNGNQTVTYVYKEVNTGNLNEKPDARTGNKDKVNKSTPMTGESSHIEDYLVVLAFIFFLVFGMIIKRTIGSR